MNIQAQIITDLNIYIYNKSDSLFSIYLRVYGITTI